MWRPLVIVMTVCPACALELPEPRNCDVRQAFWVDADSDGVGDPGTMYVGCQAPEGYVSTPPDRDTDTDTDTDSDTDTDTDTDTGTGTR